VTYHLHVCIRLPVAMYALSMKQCMKSEFQCKQSSKHKAMYKECVSM